MSGLISSVLIICLVTLPNVANVYLANLIYYPFFIINRDVKYNRNAIFLWLVFLLEYCASVVHYVLILHGSLTNRFIISTLFTIQYFVLCIETKIDKVKFEKNFVLVSSIYSFAIVGMFFLNNVYAVSLNFFVHSRMWGSSIFYGWPNTTGLPIVFALFLLFKNNEGLFKKWQFKALFLLAIILTTSRTAVLGASLVIGFYIIYPKRGRIKAFFRERVCLLIILIFIVVFAMSKVKFGVDIVERLLYTEDRMEILDMVKVVLAQSPVLGFGGDTVDNAANLFHIFANTTHTHNFVLELLIRYGILGTITFCGILLSIFKNIRNTDNRMMFIIMWILALLQIYVRDFCFLFLVSYLCWNDKTDYLCEKRNNF